MGTAGHWDELFSDRPSRSFGWYEDEPSTLVDVLALSEPSDSVIDVGAGTSFLVDRLLDRGYGDITLVDLAPSALDEVARRLEGDARADGVDMSACDVADLGGHRTWNVWHDRAVFHFMVEPAQRAAYLAALDRSLAPDGVAVIATFAPDGPGSCAGLPVERYDAAGLADVFAGVLEPLECRVKAVTDDDLDRRPYTICRFRRSATRSTQEVDS